MRRNVAAFLCLMCLSSASVLRAQTPATFRILLGVTDTAASRWDGTIIVTQASHYSLEGWRFEGTDFIDGNSFYLSTHPARLFAVPAGGGAVVANGLTLNVDDAGPDSEFSFTTAQGDFRFRASEVTYAKGIYRLGGRVYVDRIPVARRLTNTPEEEDYPSLAAAADGSVWLAYLQFHHSPDHNKLSVSPHQAPRDFAPYQQPTGGDQVWARRYSGGTWGEPISLTAAGGDLYRTALAVDGTGRAWVFWSENRGGNFDIVARSIDSAGPQEKVQISREAGADIDPVATTDSSGKVWVAWQGWRNGRAAIFAADQEGQGFSAPAKISNSSRNEWEPAIAADKTGRVAVAWDSYRNGNYDVYVRVSAARSWGPEVAIAATPRYEAYPSIAYDPNGCLWVAYEEGGRAWGKDYGAYSTTGVALYQGRAIKLRGLEPGGRFVALDAPLEVKLVGAPSLRADRTGSQSDAQSYDPDPSNAMHRLPDGTATPNLAAAKNTMPRLSIDSSGRIWLAFRTAHPTWWNPIGSVWTEYLVSFDGKTWTNPIFLNHSDNLLDNRPALASLPDGRLLMVNSSDGRRNFQVSERISNPLGLDQNSLADPYNNDLWSDEVDLGRGQQTLPVVADAARAVPASMSALGREATDGAEVAAIKRLRDYRGGPDADLRIVRGEFHRHSEISMDGGGDGSILDQWRYILDAADLDWVGCCDHDNGGDREYSWWITQQETDIFHAPGSFIPMFSYERSVGYPEGHRNIIFVQRGIRPLPRLGPSTIGTAPNPAQPGHAADTQMLYAYLRQFDGIVASHTSGTTMGTDWRDNDPNAEPVVEIYQGIRQSYEMPGGPRTNSEKDSVGGWRPKGFVNLALDKGYRLGFESSSDHFSTHMSYSLLYVKELTRESILAALRKRHVYAATDNILADVESGPHMMGDEFSTSALPSLTVKLKGTSRFAKVVIVRDGKYVYSTTPDSKEVDFSWRDNQPNPGKTSYYYVRGEQDDGEIVWVSPMWITYTGQ